jgi:hypothetical protein
VSGGGPTRSQASLVFRRGETRPSTPVLFAFIFEHREKFRFEPTCTVLTEHGHSVAPSTATKTLTASRSDGLHDVEIVALMEADQSGRASLSRAGLTGVLRTRKYAPRSRPRAVTERPTRLDRDFTATAPNSLVADITYVTTWSGTVYVAFVFYVSPTSRSPVCLDRPQRDCPGRTGSMFPARESSIWVRRVISCPTAGATGSARPQTFGGLLWPTARPGFPLLDRQARWSQSRRSRPVLR